MAAPSGAIKLRTSEEHPLSGVKPCISFHLLVVSQVALFIIACVAAAGAFPSPLLGYIALTLGAGSLVLMLPAIALCGEGETRIFTVITLAAVIPLYATLGGLGAAGVLNNFQLGWGILGVNFSVFGLVMCGMFGMGTIGTCCSLSVEGIKACCGMPCCEEMVGRLE